MTGDDKELEDQAACGSQVSVEAGEGRRAGKLPGRRMVLSLTGSCWGMEMQEGDCRDTNTGKRLNK